VALADLTGEAPVPEVAHGGPDGPLVALDDQHRQTAPDRLDGVGQSDDAGPDDHEVCVTAPLVGHWCTMNP